MGREQTIVTGIEEVIEKIREWNGKKYCIISLNSYQEIIFDWKILVNKETVNVDKWCVKSTSLSSLIPLFSQLKSGLLYGRKTKFYLVSRDRRLSELTRTLSPHTMVAIPLTVKPNVNEVYKIIDFKDL